MEEGILFFHNDAVKGGAMAVFSPESLDMSGVTFRSNFAEYGGAVLAVSTVNSSKEFQGCVFEDNTATDGGALFFYTSAGTDNIVNCVFTGNFASEI